MGHIQRSDRHRAQALSNRKAKTRNEIGELREENRQLRELIAHLSKLTVTQITEAAESGEQSASTED
jgi:hypothetical protein